MPIGNRRSWSADASTARQLARDGNGCNLGPATGADAQKKGAERSRSLGRGPGGFDQHSAGVGTSALADAPMLGKPETGLPDTRVQTDIADEFLGIGKSPYIADRRNQAGSNNEVDAGDREQSLNGWIANRRLCDLALENRQILAQPIELTQMSFDCRGFVIGDHLSRKPDPAQPPKQIGMRTWRDQMSMQDRVHLILDLRTVPDNLVAPRHQPPQPLRLGIG